MKENDFQMESKSTPEEFLANQRIRQAAWIILVILLVSFLGMAGRYLKWGQNRASKLDVVALQKQVNPVEGYALSVAYGDLGPQLVNGGVFSYEAFAAIYENSGNPLTAEQIEILRNGSGTEIIINADNAHFLLNLFWAVGLANRNSILTEGPMVQRGREQVDRFASTGGWSIGNKPVTELYASMNLISLTPEQQDLVEMVASAIYRPCCDNSTLFPDCNHGMAMLGILELMASQGATADEMFEAAKYVNAYWFPQQTLDIAVYLQARENIDFASADARLVVSETFSSGSGAARIHQELQSMGLLEASPSQGGSCSN